MFRLGSSKADVPVVEKLPPPYLTVFASETYRGDRDAMAVFQAFVPDGQRFETLPPPAATSTVPVASDFVLCLFINPALLDGIADQVLTARQAGRPTVMIVAINSTQLVSLGQWLEKRATEGRLEGVRLMIAADLVDVAKQLGSRLVKVTESNVIRMPVSTEVENSAIRNWYVFSPGLQALVARVRGYAQNGVTRACLLGGPGSGKTSLAFYYFLIRGLGQFISVNLAAENVGDKAAIKSLLCGHVSGAFPGAGARSGAISQARDGVCFLDESHEISGAVMEVLMEVLDSNQYMPFGASAKRQMECALLYATNRSWTHLQNTVNLDQFARMGAAILQVPPLSSREEDMIAVTASILAKLAKPCVTWPAPVGMSIEAWRLMRECPWHGNVRAVIRVLEAAFVDTASRGNGETLIQLPEIERGIGLWEPKTHHSHQLYAAA